MGLFGDDEIKKMMAEAEAMMTINNRALFRESFLHGYTKIKNIHNLAYTRVFYETVYSLSNRTAYKNINLAEWSYAVGELAGIMKFDSTKIIVHKELIPLITATIKNLYSHCSIMGEEKARRIIRTLILAWQKRINPEVTMDPDSNKHYREFLAGLKGL